MQHLGRCRWAKKEEKGNGEEWGNPESRREARYRRRKGPRKSRREYRKKYWRGNSVKSKERTGRKVTNKRKGIALQATRRAKT